MKPNFFKVRVSFGGYENDVFVSQNVLHFSADPELYVGGIVLRAIKEIEGKVEGRRQLKSGIIRW